MSTDTIYRRANYFQGYKISRILKISLKIKNFVKKFSRLWTTGEIFTARSDKMCERFEDESVIQTVASYTKILYAHHWKDTPEPKRTRQLLR